MDLADLKQLEEKALNLPANQRETLANHLFHSVHSREINQIDKAWLEEADKRYQAFIKNPSSGLPSKEAFKEIESDLEWK